MTAIPSYLARYDLKGVCMSRTPSHLPAHLTEIRNPDLVAAMEALAASEADPQARSAFYQTLQESVLIIPTIEPDEDSPEAETAQPDQSQIMAFENDAGQSVLIAFTDEDAALNWQPEPLPTIGMHARDVLSLAANNPISALVLNPAGPATTRIGRAELAAVARGSAPAPVPDPEAVPEGTTVLIAPPPEDPPDDWIEAFSEILANYPSIDAAYFFQLQMPAQEGRLVIGLDLYQGMPANAQARLLRTMLDEFEEKMPEGGELDFVILDDPDFLETVRDTVNPIYEADLG
jgi:hypothetical protein